MGIAWLQQNPDGVEAERSTAETAYYATARDRPKLHLLVRYCCMAVKFEGNTTGAEITS